MCYRVEFKLIYTAVLHYKDNDLVQLAQPNPAPTPWVQPSFSVPYASHPWGQPRGSPWKVACPLGNLCGGIPDRDAFRLWILGTMKRAWKKSSVIAVCCCGGLVSSRTHSAPSSTGVGHCSLRDLVHIMARYLEVFILLIHRGCLVCCMKPRGCVLDLRALQKPDSVASLILVVLTSSFRKRICCCCAPLLGRPLSSMMLAEILIVL